MSDKTPGEELEEFMWDQGVYTTAYAQAVSQACRAIAREQAQGYRPAESVVVVGVYDAEIGMPGFASVPVPNGLLDAIANGKEIAHRLVADDIVTALSMAREYRVGQEQKAEDVD